MTFRTIISKIDTIEKSSYLYEDLNQDQKTSYKLWESAGYKLKEAALTADQIQQIFQNIEQGATDAGGNRTLLGKGKDAASAVNKAWEDLKGKVYNSGPMTNFASAYDKAAENLKQATGGDQGVFKYVQKYRAFAEKHPIIQGLLYSALIAAAGITGAGLGGAAVLGLFKLTDQLLQGKDIRSALYQGAKTGAMAYGASKLGDLIRGEKPDVATGAQPNNTPGATPGTDGTSRLINKPGDFGGSSIVDRVNDNPMASPTMKKLAQKLASGEVLTDKEMDILDAMELRAVKMSDMLNAPGSSGVGMKGAELTLATGEKVVGDAAAQAANANFGAIQDLKNKAIELAGQAKYGSDSLSGGVNSLAGQVAQAAADKIPKGANFDPDYLQRVIAGEVSRPKISSDDARQALDWQAQNGGQQVTNQPPVSAGKSGYSQEYLQGVIDGKHPRPLISKEKAAELLKQGAQAVTDNVPKGANFDPDYLQRVIAGEVARPKISADDARQALDWQAQNGGQQVTNQPPVSAGRSGYSQEYLQGVIDGKHPRPLISKEKAAELLRQGAGIKQESYVNNGKKLTEGHIELVFSRVAKKHNQMVNEGALDFIKGAAGKAMNWAATKGKNLTTKITADKLNSAWKKAGSPTDSNELGKVLTGAGVDSQLINQVFASLKIPEISADSSTDTGDKPVNMKDILKQIKQEFGKLDPDEQKQILAYLLPATGKA